MNKKIFLGLAIALLTQASPSFALTLNPEDAVLLDDVAKISKACADNIQHRKYWADKWPHYDILKPAAAQDYARQCKADVEHTFKADTDKGNNLIAAGQTKIQVGNEKIAKGNAMIQGFPEKKIQSQQINERGHELVREGNAIKKKGDAMFAAGDVDEAKPGIAEGKRRIDQGNALIKEAESLLQAAEQERKNGEQLVAEGKNDIAAGNKQIEEGNQAVAQVQPKINRLVRGITLIG